MKRRKEIKNEVSLPDKVPAGYLFIMISKEDAAKNYGPDKYESCSEAVRAMDLFLDDVARRMLYDPEKVLTGCRDQAHNYVMEVWKDV